jgi:hypothetical protein
MIKSYGHRKGHPMGDQILRPEPRPLNLRLQLELSAEVPKSQRKLGEKVPGFRLVVFFNRYVVGVKVRQLACDPIFRQRPSY